MHEKENKKILFSENMSQSLFFASYLELLNHYSVFPLEINEAQKFVVKLISACLFLVVLSSNFGFCRRDALNDVFEFLKELFFRINCGHRPVKMKTILSQHSHGN